MKSIFKKISRKKLFIVALVIFGILFLTLRLWMLISNSIPLLAKITRVENTTPCTPTTNNDQIYYGGNGADYISNSDGKNFSKIWDKQGIGVAFGVPSPDGSKIAYIEDDGLWIRCTTSKGQIKVDFSNKTIDNQDYSPRLIIKSVHWSPDSKKLVLNYAGDVITVDAETKEKQILVKDAAFKIFQIKRTATPPSGIHSLAPWYYDFNQGTVFWATNGDIFYTKFVGSQKVELRRTSSSSATDELIITGDFPMIINNISPDQAYILLSEEIWKDQINKSPSYKSNYAINLNNKQIVSELYNQSLTNMSTGILSKKVIWSKDGRLVYIGDDGNSPVGSNSKMMVTDLETGKNQNLTQAIKAYLQNNMASSLEFYGFSHNNAMLICVNCEDYQQERQILLMDQNGNISEIYKDSNIKREIPPYLWPKSWL